MVKFQVYVELMHLDDFVPTQILWLCDKHSTSKEKNLHSEEKVLCLLNRPHVFRKSTQSPKKIDEHWHLTESLYTYINDSYS